MRNRRRGRDLGVGLVVNRATTSHLEDPNQPATADEVDIDELAHAMDEMQRMLWWDDGLGDWDAGKEVDASEVLEHLTALMSEMGLRPGGGEDERPE